ncbi:transposase family protein [Nonomuraea sp. NPDC052129]|uniref:transposase family protein n=1 Tax=Nonomuraea sp. NPDC052129 TaxID=3154651 RepID=UPI0034220F3F
MGVGSLEGVLFPGIDVRLERVSVSAEVLCVAAAACGPPPRCPSCRGRARRVHSAYERGLAERPLGGQQLIVRLRVRRFFCDRPSCRRRTFVEQVDGRTPRVLGVDGFAFRRGRRCGTLPSLRRHRGDHLAAGGDASARVIGSGDASGSPASIRPSEQ